MKLTIAARFEHKLAPWRTALADHGGIQFRIGTMPEVGFGCDAIIMPSYLAHDRYGGFYNREHAQVLENLRSDGVPDLIVCTPAYAPVTSLESDTSVLAGRIRWVFSECLDRINSFNSEADDLRIDDVLIVVGALGFGPYESTLGPTALREALAAHPSVDGTGG
ncbi:hypothetical protein [Nocardia arthritidis]|uniref:Uncharacterized protein n=1 Tax=Nocardia arthritidis TaxID=228602 RepID=A0A6G9YQ73_9NOCA|nr:hypothetical protein [Nocardia arthritidis]QIS15364.1 hypothetical protein F5544_37690 [Nocardia arthritidis]